MGPSTNKENLKRNKMSPEFKEEVCNDCRQNCGETYTLIANVQSTDLLKDPLKIYRHCTYYNPKKEKGV